MRIVLLLLAFTSIQSFARPDHYTELLDYVQEAPDQGEAATCLFMGNTGAMELMANKFHNIKNPVPYGPYDLAESFSMWAPRNNLAKTEFDIPIQRLSAAGYGIHISDWPFEAWTDNRGVNQSVWSRHPQMNSLPRIPLPQIDTEKLFQLGRDRWATRVLKEEHVEMVKEALWKNKGPVIINYNDTYYWHVILIVGYDDRLPGVCHDTDPKECGDSVGSFYVRDSFGVRAELRDYDWFRIKANTAIAVKFKEKSAEE